MKGIGVGGRREVLREEKVGKTLGGRFGTWEAFGGMCMGLVDEYKSY